MEKTKPTSDSDLLRQVERTGGARRFAAYARLSGPGWLQSALKLGSASMSTSLYLGVLGGFALLWVQPVAMLFGIIMLSAIGYVTLSTGKRPFQAINDHVSPVLGWGWALGALAASIVWSVPQYSLAIGVLEQNLLPSLLGEEGPLGGSRGGFLVSAALIVVCGSMVWSYGSGGRGSLFFYSVLKLLVMMVVLCFMGVVLRLAFMPGGLDWTELLKGFLPDPRALFQPTEGYVPLIDAVAPEHRAYWKELLVSRQRDLIVASAAASAGINGTFLFAYSLLRRGWGPEFRGFLKFDLLTSMFIPFAIATSCVVVAGAHQFHAQPQPGVMSEADAEVAAATPRQTAEYRRLLEGRVRFALPEGSGELDEVGVERAIGSLGLADRRLAATMVTRDAFDLSSSLRPLTGPIISNFIFGLGVLGMSVSTVILLMLISGFVICEMLGRPHVGAPLRMGIAAVGLGALFPFFWSGAYFWLAVPTSVFASMLIPIAYITFFLLMNRPSLLGLEMPRGRRRIAWNTLMIVAISVFTFSAFYMIWNRSGVWGLMAAGIFIAAAIATRKTLPPHQPSS